MTRVAAKGRVLIVEDESVVAMMVEDVVADLGYEVAATAGRLEPALELARELDIEFAIIDVNLNGKLTYPVAEALRARDIPFIFATGYGAAGLTDEWRDRPVLQKPFTAKAVGEAIDQLLSG